MNTLATDHVIKECLAADVIICVGVGKSACIATLTAEFLQNALGLQMMGDLV